MGVIKQIILFMSVLFLGAFYMSKLYSQSESIDKCDNTRKNQSGIEMKKIPQNKYSNTNNIYIQKTDSKQPLRIKIKIHALGEEHASAQVLTEFTTQREFASVILVKKFTRGEDDFLEFNFEPNDSDTTFVAMKVVQINTRRNKYGLERDMELAEKYKKYTNSSSENNSILMRYFYWIEFEMLNIETNEKIGELSYLNKYETDDKKRRTFYIALEPTGFTVVPYDDEPISSFVPCTSYFYRQQE